MALSAPRWLGPKGAVAGPREAVESRLKAVRTGLIANFEPDWFPQFPQKQADLGPFPPWTRTEWALWRGGRTPWPSATRVNVGDSYQVEGGASD